MLLTVAFELESADCEAAALLFSFCDSSFAEGGRRMHMAAWPSRMTFGLEINPTITPICCTISSRVVSCGKRKKKTNVDMRLANVHGIHVRCVTTILHPLSQ